MELQKEHRRQEENDKLRRDFARQANAFHQWLTETRAAMMETSGTLEEQLELLKKKVGVHGSDAFLSFFKDCGFYFCGCIAVTSWNDQYILSKLAEVERSLPVTAKIFSYVFWMLLIN